MPASAAGASRTIDSSAALCTLIDDGGGERCGQHWHHASESGTTGKGFDLLAAGRHEPCNRPATIGDRHLVALADLFDQRGEVLPSFTDCLLLSWFMVLHVAQIRKRPWPLAKPATY